MIEVSDLSFAYQSGYPVLKRISVKISQGELCFVVGASGSGKSTFLRVLAGILPSGGAGTVQALEGCVAIDGRTPIAYRRSAGTGLVPQDYSLLPFLSVFDNVAWPIRYGRPSRIAKERVVPETLRIVGLTEKVSVYPHALSGGMKARLAIARALVGGPRLLLIDEAFAALDVGWRTNIYGLLAELRKTLGLTIIVISHDLAEASELADRVIVLSAIGSLAADIQIPSENRPTERLIRDIQNAVMRDHPSRPEPEGRCR